MRKLMFVSALLALGGCSTVGAVLSGNVNNPITPKVAYQIQASIDEVAIAAGTYARQPRCPTAAPLCSDQNVVAQLRTYVNAGEAAAHKLNAFVLANPTLDAHAIYQAALDAVSVAQSFAISNGVK